VGAKKKEDPTQQELLCQWFTPPTVAEQFLAWCRLRPDDVLLEPAAGEGALIPEDHPQVMAFEIDPDRCAELRVNRPLATVACCDFLSLPVPERPVADVAVQNPPYVDDGEGIFIERALHWARRVCALIRLEALHGKDRYARCWQHVQLTRLAVLIHRPHYLGPYGARTKYHPQYSYVALEAIPRNGQEAFPVETSWVHWK
jgi:hypothetical protein